jgi:hypothetical protein
MWREKEVGRILRVYQRAGVSGVGCIRGGCIRSGFKRNGMYKKWDLSEVEYKRWDVQEEG